MSDSRKKRRRPKCPECGAESVAEIFWGLPVSMDAIRKDLDSKKIVLGGCLVSDDDPRWECNKCHHQWGKRRD